MAYTLRVRYFQQRASAFPVFEKNSNL